MTTDSESSLIRFNLIEVFLLFYEIKENFQSFFMNLLSKLCKNSSTEVFILVFEHLQNSRLLFSLASFLSFSNYILNLNDFILNLQLKMDDEKSLFQGDVQEDQQVETQATTFLISSSSSAVFQQLPSSTQLNTDSSECFFFGSMEALRQKPPTLVDFMNVSPEAEEREDVNRKQVEEVETVTLKRPRSASLLPVPEEKMAKKVRFEKLPPKVKKAVKKPQPPKPSQVQTQGKVKKPQSSKKKSPPTHRERSETLPPKRLRSKK